LLQATPEDLERVLAAADRRAVPAVADRVRLQAKRLTHARPAQRGRVLPAAEALVLALYRHGTPPGWLCAWCDASVMREGPLRRVGVGAIVLDRAGRPCARVSRQIAECGSFEAEIAALEAALAAAAAHRDHGAPGIRVYTDCDALVSLWLQHRHDLRLRAVRVSARKLGRFELRSLPRRHNQVAHHLARAGAPGDVPVPSTRSA
jgi:ribonuclease HI